MYRGSLERHRALRGEFERLKRLINKRSALQFSSDLSIDASYFDKFEVSEYEGINHLDLMSINRKNKQYSFVSCIHVLEHVSDDIKAVQELVRIIDDHGLIFLCVPSPESSESTVDWGFPDWSQHGHFRVYGSDFFEKLNTTCTRLEAFCIERELMDPVTSDTTILYLITKSQRLIAMMPSTGEILL